MQPAPSKRARFLHIIVGGWLLALGGLGCTSPPEHGGTYAAFGALDTIEATDTPRDSALAVLARLDRTAFDSAFARLDAHAVTRDVRTEQLDTTGATTAYRTRTLRYPPGTGPGTIQQADSAGRFQAGGFLARLTPSQSPRARPGNLAGQALADQPAYLAPPHAGGLSLRPPPRLASGRHADPRGGGESALGRTGRRPEHPVRPPYD